MNWHFSLVIQADVTQLESILHNEKIKHAHWVSLDNEFLRFTPVLKPFLFPTQDNAFDQSHQEIQLIFKDIEPFRSTNITNGDLIDGSNTVNYTEVVRHSRRRKFGRKRRSTNVKQRVVNKNSSFVINDDDEQSQEYISRRRTTSINELTKDEEETTGTSSSSSSPSKPVENSTKEKHIPNEDPSSTIITKSLADSTSESIEQPLQKAWDSTTVKNSPLPFKKRPWTSTNLQDLLDPPIVPKV